MFYTFVILIENIQSFSFFTKWIKIINILLALRVNIYDSSSNVMLYDYGIQDFAAKRKKNSIFSRRIIIWGLIFLCPFAEHFPKTIDKICARVRQSENKNSKNGKNANFVFSNPDDE